MVVVIVVDVVGQTFLQIFWHFGVGAGVVVVVVKSL